MARIEIQKDQPYTFSWSFYDKNIMQVPGSGTVTVTNPGGTELVASTAVSIETNGEIRYTLAAANTSTVDENYRIELVYRVGDVYYRPFYLFDIVRTPLQNTVRDEDLFYHVGELRTQIKPNMITTTSAGTSSTFISTGLRPLNIDFTGGHCEIFIDDTTTHSAEITDWQEALNQITFTPNYTAIIGSGLQVRIRSSYQRFIDRAFERFVSRDVRDRIGLKARFVDTTALDNLTVFKTLELICFSKVEDTDDIWDIRTKKFEKMYKDEYVKLREPVDYDDDGSIDSDENASRPSFINKGIVR